MAQRYGRPGRSPQAKLLKDARRATLLGQVEKLRVIHRLKADRVPAGGSPQPSCSPEETVGGRLGAIGDLAFDLARFQISTHNALLELSAKHSDRVIADLRQLFRKRPQAAPTVHTEVVLTAIANVPNGDFLFEVENRFTTAMFVSLSASDFQRLPDGRPIQLAVQFTADPPVQSPHGDRYLEPRACRTFRLGFTPSVQAGVEPGREYRLSIFVSTDRRILDELPLRVRVTGKRVDPCESVPECET